MTAIRIEKDSCISTKKSGRDIILDGYIRRTSTRIAVAIMDDDGDRDSCIYFPTGYEGRGAGRHINLPAVVSPCVQEIGCCKGMTAVGPEEDSGVFAG